MLAALGVSCTSRARYAKTAGGLELTEPLQVLADGDGVGRLVALDEVRDGQEDQPVVGAIQILGGDDVRNLIPRSLIEHEPAEQRLLGLYRVRREPQPLRGAAGDIGGCSGFGHRCVELAARNRGPATGLPLRPR